ncbi:MAG: hypothetical protein WEG56_09785 [Chloroflexota bacterium]
MSGAKFGAEFVTHEFDEAIAVQQSIVDAQAALSESHPVASAKRALKSSLADDRRFLQQLKRFGKQHEATGKVEDVAGGLKELMDSTLATAKKDGADSDFYEAHAVLLNLKRKQMDSAGAVIKIARATKDTELRDAATEFERGQRESSRTLAKELADYAVDIAQASRA